MKNIFIIFLLLFTVSCHSETFKFRDHYWGTDIKTIIEHEEEKEYEMDKIDVYKILNYDKIPLAGYEVRLEYYFKNDKLIGGKYYLPKKLFWTKYDQLESKKNGFIPSDNDRLSIFEPVYNDLRDKLEKLYGNCIEDKTMDILTEEWFHKLYPYGFSEPYFKNSHFFISRWTLQDKTKIYLVLSTGYIILDESIILIYGSKDYFELWEKIKNGELNSEEMNNEYDGL